MFVYFSCFQHASFGWFDLISLKRSMSVTVVNDLTKAWFKIISSHATKRELDWINGLSDSTARSKDIDHHCHHITWKTSTAGLASSKVRQTYGSCAICFQRVPVTSLYPPRLPVCRRHSRRFWRHRPTDLREMCPAYCHLSQAILRAICSLLL